MSVMLVRDTVSVAQRQRRLGYVCGGVHGSMAGMPWRAVGRSRRWLVKDVERSRTTKRPSSTLQSQNTAAHTKVHVVVSQKAHVVLRALQHIRKCTSSSLQVHVVREKRRPAKPAAALRGANYTKDLVKYVVLLAAGADEAAVEQLLARLRHSCFF